MNRVVVCRFDGTMGCGSGERRPLEEDERDLRALGATQIFGSANVPGPFPVCRACHICPTGMVNAFAIPAEDWERILVSIVGPAGFMLWEGAPYPDELGGGSADLAAGASRPAGAGRSLIAQPVLLRDILGYQIRVMGPDSGGTTEWVPDRVTFVVGKDDRIQDIQIG